MSKGVILITGFWPPTNKTTPEGILDIFSGPDTSTAMPRIHGEQYFRYWWGGYDFVVIAPTFPNASPNPADPCGDFYGQGVGDWNVNYQQVSKVFWDLVAKYNPVAVMTFSRNTCDVEWHLETAVTNLPQASWYHKPPLDFAGVPFAGGGAGDPAPPNKGHHQAGNPPDATRTQNYVLQCTADTMALQIQIKKRIEENIGSTQVKPVIVPKTIPMGSGPKDNFVSAFTGYHAVWYDVLTPHCRIGFHTHVGAEVAPYNGQYALYLQIDRLVNFLG